MTNVTLPRKDLFELPEGMIYLDGNSLGPLPKSVNAALSSMVTDQWGAHLIKGWNVDDWMGQPMRVGNMVGKLIGAPKNAVTMGDTLSVKVYQALSAAVQMRPDRRVILSDSGNFPSDLYMAQGLIAQVLWVFPVNPSKVTAFIVKVGLAAHSTRQEASAPPITPATP